MESFFVAMLAQCDARLGTVPRRFSFWERLTYLKVDRPAWLPRSSKDDLNTLFRGISSLWRDGKVVWGQVIQANGLLFSPGPNNHPAEFVYSVDHSGRITTAELARVAGVLFSLKNTTPSDPGLASIADYLTDEYIRVFGRPVPKPISPDHPCQISSSYVIRKHLAGPQRAILKSTLPLLVSPTEPHIALPLPSRYWPGPLVDWWNFTT